MTDSSRSPTIFWKDVAGFSKYEISNFGSVRNKKSLKILKARFDKKFWVVSLTSDERGENGKQKTQTQNIHRLVAKAHIHGENDRKKYVDHIDANRDNFDSKNLRWVTAKENLVYQHQKTSVKVILQLNRSGELIKRWCKGIRRG